MEFGEIGRFFARANVGDRRAELACATEKAMPPLAVPSSLAIMISVMSTDFANSLA